ncbi:MAG: hypothetical protein ACJ77Z_17925 [Thermoleophilaceae bacterium]
MRRIRSRLSFANVISLIALFVALGGTGYAAVKLSPNSVTSKAIKRGAVTNSDLAKNAVTGSKVKDGSLLKQDFAVGQVPAGPSGPAGPQGAAGPQGLPGTHGADGAQGPPGVATAFARLQADGTLLPTNAPDGPEQSKDITQAMIEHGTTGQYCFGNLGFRPRSAMVALDNANTVSPLTINKVVTVSVSRGNPLTLCPAGFTDVRVNIVKIDDTANGNAPPALSDHGFIVWFEK